MEAYKTKKVTSLKKMKKLFFLQFLSCYFEKKNAFAKKSKSNKYMMTGSVEHYTMYFYMYIFNTNMQ